MLTLSDEESEPTTEDEDEDDDDESPTNRLSNRLSLVDIKPVIQPSPPPVTSTFKIPAAAQDVKVRCFDSSRLQGSRD